MSDVNFNGIPSGVSSIFVPGSYIEIDANNPDQGLSQGAKILVVGQRLSTGTVVAETPVLVTSKADAITYFGRGSMLAQMFNALFDNNSLTEKWAIALDDDGAGTAASGTITVTVSSNLAGTISLYMGGVLVPVQCAAGDTVTVIASAIKDAINARNDLPVTATSSVGVVTITYRHKGLVGNKYDVRVNYSGSLAGEATPSGVTLAIVQLANGATDPDVADAFAVLQEEVFNFMCFPYIGSANLNAIDDELESRWGPLKMLEGHAIVADTGSVGTMSTLGNSRNSQFMTLLDCGINSPTPPYIFAAAACGQIAYAASNDPARPFTGLVMKDVLPMPVADRRTLSERDTLLHDGVATHLITSDSNVALERMVTTYQTNSAGITDRTYLDANTLFTVSYYRQTLRATLSQFVRFKLAGDDATTSPGQYIATPKSIRSAIVALAGSWQALGLLENIEQFKAQLIVQRNSTDPTRVDVVLPPDLVNPLQVIAAQIKFTV